MATRSETVRFDDQCDVAAVVYARRDRPDDVITGFASDLRSRGFNVAGAVQRRSTDAVGHRLAADLVIMPSGRSMSFAPTQLSDREKSGASILLEAERQLLEAVATRPDLVVINRFGWSERSGGGLLSVLSEAVNLDVPVLLAVPEALFGDWIQVSGGLAVKLPCRRTSLERWWNSVSGMPRSDPSRATFCELK